MITNRLANETFEISPRFRSTLEERIARLERDAEHDEAQVSQLQDGDHIRRQMRLVALERSDALRCKRWNMLHPTAAPKKSYVETLLAKEPGVFVAVSDYMRLVPDQIAPWVPGGLMTLGTDGFGRSDTRARLRRFFEVDAESIVIATLYALAEKGLVERQLVEKAIKELGVNSEKVQPQIV